MLCSEMATKTHLAPRGGAKLPFGLICRQNGA
jgi:hypothetical protein